MSAGLPSTESADDRYRGLDTWSDDRVLSEMIAQQQRAIAAIDAAKPAIASAAGAVATALGGGGRLAYIGAGSPALMSLADALELPQTFGIAHGNILLVLADGPRIAERLDGAREDSGADGEADISARGIGRGDCVIGVSASGSTPYTVAGLAAARAAGAVTIAVAGNAGAPLLKAADIPILIETGPEVISGSTRLGAGTAQKAVLNMISTLAGVKLGHVHDNLMVNVVANNDKLQRRARRIIAQIAGVSETAAGRALDSAAGDVKRAVLIAAGADAERAPDLIARYGGRLRPALAELRES